MLSCFIWLAILKLDLIGRGDLGAEITLLPPLYCNYYMESPTLENEDFTELTILALYLSWACIIYKTCQEPSYLPRLFNSALSILVLDDGTSSICMSAPEALRAMEHPPSWSPMHRNTYYMWQNFKSAWPRYWYWAGSDILKEQCYWICSRTNFDDVVLLRLDAKNTIIG